MRRSAGERHGNNCWVVKSRRVEMLTLHWTGFVPDDIVYCDNQDRKAWC
jgi:hypothetical protein